MAIYRGPGGSGDATADSANTAQVAETFSIQAGVSAAAAAASATTASDAATAAGVAQTAAEAAQSAAETAETNAETAETNAETAQSAAEAAQLAAEEAQTAAELAETNAETAETNAELAQTAAEAAQLAAEEAQTAAELAETNAETAESGAVAAQLAAESARDSALAAYDNFDDRYLGAKTSDPTLDNDGDALVAGALYFNSVDGAMRVYTGSVWVDAYAAGQTFLAKANNLSDLPNVATARQNLDLEIGVDVQAFDATILKSADIGVTVQGYDADTAKYDDATANFTGTLQNGGSNVVVDSDIGVTVQAYDATIVVDADIGVSVQGYDADTAKYDDATANFTGTLQNGGSNVLVDTDIGSTVQAYDATIVVDADIGVTVQGYDADTTKNDVSNTFTQAQVFPSGSVSSPSITTTGDTNTGIYFPAADNIGFATNGVIRGRWTTDGLCFGSDTAAANALDDYEEGTWTATVAFGGASVGITYGNRTGNYTKIGNLVVCTMLLQVTNVGSSSGAATITGLPFSSLSFGAVNFGQIISMSFADVPFGYTSGTTITLQETTNAGGLTGLDNTNFSSSTQLIFNAVFRVA